MFKVILVLSLHKLFRPLAMRLTTICLAFVVAGCASKGKLVYVAPSNDTISVTTELGRGSTPSQNIYVVNVSTEPIIVFGIALRQCENVRQQCDTHPVNIKVNGGDRRIVFRVEPRDVEKAYSYRFNYSWRPEKQ
jgi:hypothetical protein